MAKSNILARLIELTSNVTNAYTTVLYSANQNEETFYLRDHFSLSSDVIPKTKVSFGHDPFRKAIAVEKPIIIDHFDPGAEKMEIFKKKRDLKSYLVAPVIHERLEGVLVTATKEAYGFSPRLQKIVGELAGQMAWHLSREASSLLRADNAVPSFSELAAYLRYLIGSMDPAEIAKRLIEVPSSIIACDAMAVVWFNGNGMGKVRGHRGFAGDVSRYTVVPGAGIIGTCAQSRAPVISRVFDNNLTTLFSGQEQTELFKSVAAVPILQENCLLAVLVCSSLTAEGLSQPDFDTLSVIASVAAAFLPLTESKTSSGNDKNRDPITEVYNRRFLIHGWRVISEKFFDGTQPVFFLTVQLTNLPSIYETHGIRLGDSLLRSLVSLFSQRIPSPKNIFRFTDHSFLIVILKRNREEVDSFKSLLEELFIGKPLSVNGTSLRVKTELGLSSYPDDGENLLDLANLSWTRTSEPMRATI